jgi:hypothetical protein
MILSPASKPGRQNSAYSPSKITPCYIRQSGQDPVRLGGPSG